MSAYVVDDKTINRIVSFLKDICDVPTVKTAFYDNWEWTGRAIKKLLQDAGYGGDYGLGSCDWNKLATSLKALNILSVDCRYNEKGHYDPLELNLNEPYGNVYQVVKSIKCWAYQSCEGDCDKLPLFELIQKIVREICLEIVVNSDAYDAADWG